MTDWKSFERDFKAIKVEPFNLAAKFYRYLPTQGPGNSGKWSLSGTLSGPERTRFEILASNAGLALEDLRSSLPESIFESAKPLDRWFNAVWSLTSGFIITSKDFTVDDNGDYLGIIINGNIDRIVEWSDILCLKLAALVKDEKTIEVASLPLPESTTKPKTAAQRALKRKALRLSDNGIFMDGKHYELKPNAYSMWKQFFAVKGERLHQSDFVGFEARKAIKDMPRKIAKLIIHGKPHQGYEVPRLQKQFGRNLTGKSLDPHKH